MRQRHQRTPTRSIVRYLPQATWMKKRAGALRDQLLRLRRKEKIPIKNFHTGKINRIPLRKSKIHHHS